MKTCLQSWADEILGLLNMTTSHHTRLPAFMVWIPDITIRNRLVTGTPWLWTSLGKFHKIARNGRTPRSSAWLSLYFTFICHIPRDCGIFFSNIRPQLERYTYIPHSLYCSNSYLRVEGWRLKVARLIYITSSWHGYKAFKEIPITWGL